ncbi:MAG: signal peptidase I [Longibaculum sp.]
MKYFKKILHIILNGLLAILIFVILILAISQYVLQKFPPDIFGYAPVDVLTGSMEPVFSPGDIIVIKKNTDYEINDIVTYTYQDTLITHRIIGKVAEGYITKGDANNVPDTELVNDNQIVGKYLFAIPFIGLLRIWIRSPIVIILILLIIVGIYFYSRRKEESE